ncbi:MAG TPA: FtsQ-type POTRA domain-containing protein [Anaerolineales bacterium]|nr:FtsQ-type POTRA domain-containing protein [Anaerolineales bacterium]
MARNTRTTTRTDPSRCISRHYDLSTSQLRLKASGSRGSQPPPVMVRSSASNAAAPTRRRTRPRRRFAIALPMAGAEMQLPAIPQLHLTWRIVSLALTVLVGAVLYIYWNTPLYTVKGAEISGLTRITPLEVNTVLGITGQPIFLVDAGNIQQTLETQFPEFSAIETSVSLPDSVVISVTERVPVAVWRQDGRSLYIAADGVAFPSRSQEVDPSLPVIEATANPPAPAAVPTTEEILDKLYGTGEEELTVNLTPANGAETAVDRNFMKPELVANLLTIAEQAPSGVPIVYSAEHGLGWTDPGGWQVYFGALDNIEMKLHVYGALLAHLDQEDTLPKLISVEYVHAPYFQLEQKRDG